MSLIIRGIRGATKLIPKARKKTVKRMEKSPLLKMCLPIGISPVRKRYTYCNTGPCQKVGDNNLIWSQLVYIDNSRHYIKKTVDEQKI